MLNLLDGRTNRTQDDSEEEGLWLAPLVKNLVAENFNFIRSDALNILEIGWIFRHQGAPLQSRQNVIQAELLREILYIS